MNLNKSLSLREIADTPVQVSAPPADAAAAAWRWNTTP